MVEMAEYICSLKGNILPARIYSLFYGAHCILKEKFLTSNIYLNVVNTVSTTVKKVESHDFFHNTVKEKGIYW